jgi:hypothetical protein
MNDNEEKILADIQNEVKCFYKFVANQQNLIHGQIKIKMIYIYASMMICYLSDMALLYKNGNKSSLEPLTRSFIDCYATVFIFIKYFGKNEFDDYFHYLLFEGMTQAKTIIVFTKKDKTLSEQEIKNYIDNELEFIKNTLLEYFEVNESQINYDKLETSLFKLMEKMELKYKSSSKPNLFSYKRYYISLSSNETWKSEYGEPVKYSNTLYSQLCNSVHNNLDSVIKRLKETGVFESNGTDDSALASLNLCLYCAKEINRRLDSLTERFKNIE